MIKINPVSEKSLLNLKYQRLNAYKWTLSYILKNYRFIPIALEGIACAHLYRASICRVVCVCANKVEITKTNLVSRPLNV